jgi:RNA polymerase sigma-70 factor, ECF subfamily
VSYDVAQEKNSCIEPFARFGGDVAGPVGIGPDDLELIERFKAGDKSAFEAIVVRHQTRVYNLVFRVTGLPDEASELTQEIFVKVYQKISMFRGESAFSTWLYRVAVNHAKNRLKYLSRRQYFRSESVDQPINGPDGDIQKQYESHDLNPEQSLGSSEVSRIVQEKLAELAEDYRIVVTLRDIQELDYEEIAKITGLALGTVKSRIHRGRIELKKKLAFLVREGGA